MKIHEVLPGALESSQQLIHLHCLRHVCEGSGVFWEQGRDGERLITPSATVTNHCLLPGPLCRAGSPLSEGPQETLN